MHWLYVEQCSHHFICCHHCLVMSHTEADYQCSKNAAGNHVVQARAVQVRVMECSQNETNLLAGVLHCRTWAFLLEGFNLVLLTLATSSVSTGWADIHHCPRQQLGPPAFPTKHDTPDHVHQAHPQPTTCRYITTESMQACTRWTT